MSDDPTASGPRWLRSAPTMPETVPPAGSEPVTVTAAKRTLLVVAVTAWMAESVAVFLLLAGVIR